MRTIDELEAAWSATGITAPRDHGTLRLICVRRSEGEHDTPNAVEITASRGIAGDRWASRGAGKDPEGETAVTLINATVAALISDGEGPLDAPGDNLHVDLDLAVEALPPGSLLRIGDATLRVSETPHTGCATFRDRFGLDALKWVSTPDGRARRLRGANCSVVVPGVVRVGDPILVERAASVAESALG